MTVRRLTPIVAAIVAVFVALAVPFTQLRTVATQISCCCPDPSDCHCPHEKTAPDAGGPTLRACHRTTHELAAPDSPTFAVAAMTIVATPVRVAVVAHAAPQSPHATPDPTRPSAPS